MINRYLCILVVSAAVALRLYMVWGASVWLDEAYSLQVMATKSFGEIISALWNDQGSPAYYLILRGWSALFGKGEQASALLSAILSITSLLVVYRFVSVFFKDSRLVALVLAIFAFNAVGLHQSTNVRAYALLELCAVVSYFSLWRKSLGVYVIFTLLGLYTHTYFAVVIFAQLISAPSKKLIYRSLPYITVGYLPWLPFSVHQIYLRIFEGLGGPPRTLASQGGFFNVLAVAYGGLFSSWKIGFVALIFPFLQGMYGRAALVSIALPIVISVWKPICWVGRYEVIGSLPLAMAIGTHLMYAKYPALIDQSLKKHFKSMRLPDVLSALTDYRVLMIFILLVGGIKHALWLPRQDQDRNAIEQLLAGQLTVDEGDSVIFVGLSHFSARYYFQKFGMPVTHQYIFPPDLEGKPGNLNPADYDTAAIRLEAEDLVKKVEGARRVILFETNHAEFRPLTNLLDEHFKRIKSIETPRWGWGPYYTRIIIYNSGE